MTLMLQLARLSRRSPGFRGKARLQRAITRLLQNRRTPGSEVDIEIDDIRWRLDIDDVIQFRILWDGTHDPHVVDWLTRQLAQAPIPARPVLWDVGANIGAISLAVAARLPSVRFESFEPSPRARAKLVTHLALNPRLDIRVHSLALSDRTGVASFFESAESSNGGLGALYQAANTERGSVEVPTARGDDLMAEHRAEPPDIIKIDVEGFELEVLGGLEGYLRTHRPRLCVESSAYRLDERGLDRGAVAHRLEALGYRVMLIAGRGNQGMERPVRRRDLDGNIDLAAYPD